MSSPRPTRTPRHPGRILVEDFLATMPGVTQAQVADALGISRPRLNELVNGVRGVTPDTALRLARGLGTSAEFWTGAQSAWELYEASRSRTRMRELERITPLVAAEPDALVVEVAAPSAPSIDIRTEIGVLAAEFATQPEGPTLEHYEEFLTRKGLLNEARRFVRIRAQLDALGKPRRGRGSGAAGRLPALVHTAPALTFTD